MILNTLSSTQPPLHPPLPAAHPGVHEAGEGGDLGPGLGQLGEGEVSLVAEVAEVVAAGGRVQEEGGQGGQDQAVHHWPGGGISTVVTVFDKNSVNFCLDEQDFLKFL